MLKLYLRLGIDICAPHTLTAQFSRHADQNNIFKRSLASADVLSILEPVGLVRDDGKRVDGMSLIPRSRGKTLIWDSTCADNFGPSNIKFSVREAGRAAENTAKRKEKNMERR